MFLSLPAAGANVDKIFMVEKIDSAATTVYLVPNGTDTIKGSAVWYPISTQYAWVIIQSDGSSSWKIIGQYVAASGGGGAPTTDTYVLYPTSDTPNLPNSRTAAAGKNIFFTDGGAGSTLTIEANPVTATSGATTNLTATSNSVLIVNASGGPATVNLPAVSGNANKKFTVKKVDSSANTVTVTANGSDTIDGSTSQVLTIQYQSQDIIAGTTANQWNIV